MLHLLLMFYIVGALSSDSEGLCSDDEPPMKDINHRLNCSENKSEMQKSQLWYVIGN